MDQKGRPALTEKDTLLITPSGLAKLEQELDHLKTVRRREVAARIKQALEFGDISENSEYDDAKNEQAFIEGRIAALEKTLRQVRVVSEDDFEAGVVTVGSRVRVKDLDTDEEFEFTLVGPAESNPSENLISNKSPVGSALMGKEVGAVVKVAVPAGVIRYEILEVSR